MAATWGRSLFFGVALLCLLGLARSLTDRNKLKESRKSLEDLQQKLARLKEENLELSGLSTLLTENLKPISAFLGKEAPKVTSLDKIKTALDIIMEQAVLNVRRCEETEANITRLEKDLRIQAEMVEILEAIHGGL